MNYILCHKDIPVLRFSTEDEEISEVSEVICREHLPVEISPDNEKGKTLKSQFPLMVERPLNSCEPPES